MPLQNIENTDYDYEQNWAALEASQNPFAVVVMAQEFP